MAEDTATAPAWASKVLELLATQQQTDPRRHQRWLAAMIGVHEGQLSRMLTGERQASALHIERMAAALGVPLHWLTGTKEA